MVDQFDLGSEFFALLEQFDEEITRRVASERCPWCGGPLHRGDYGRKPRGALIAPAAEKSVRRFSLCCGRRGCRRRALPPSLRFLGRRVYAGAVVIVASMLALMLGTAGAILRTTGVPARTTRRWLGWWQGPFISTEVFVAVCARLIGVKIEELPTSIVDRLDGTLKQRVRTMLDLLAPITTDSVADGARFLRVAA